MFFSDCKLDNLKVIRDKARQDYYDAKNKRFELGKRCYELFDELEAAYANKKVALGKALIEQEKHNALMGDIRAKIAFYEEESRQRYADMIYAYKQASESFKVHDGALAKSLSESAKSYRKMMRSAKGHVGSLVGDSKMLHQAFKESATQDAYKQSEKEVCRLKAEYAEASILLKEAKKQLDERSAAFDMADKVFRDRLELLRYEEKVAKAERYNNRIKNE